MMIGVGRVIKCNMKNKYTSCLWSTITKRMDGKRIRSMDTNPTLISIVLTPQTPKDMSMPSTVDMSAVTFGRNKMCTSRCRLHVG